jgi:glycosyltransferase involved in cell wall biosynthesis
LYIDSFLSKKKCMSKISFYLRRLLVIISIKSCDLILTASKSLLKDIKQTVKISDRNAVVNNFGVLLEKFNKNRQSSENIALLSDGRIIKLLYVSEYSDYKNLTTLLKALKLLNRDEKLKFLLTSTLDPMQFSKVDVASRDIDKKLLSDAEIANCIYCTGSIKYENIENLYKENDIFIFPSLVESFGYPLVEAMASGLPIVASDTPINREICENAAVYFNAMDSKDLTQKILEVSQNKELRNFLINAGLKRVRLCFDFKMHIKRMLDIFIMLSSEGKV